MNIWEVFIFIFWSDKGEHNEDTETCWQADHRGRLLGVLGVGIMNTILSNPIENKARTKD